jgi:hypothetical protein
LFVGLRGLGDLAFIALPDAGHLPRAQPRSASDPEWSARVIAPGGLRFLRGLGLRSRLRLVHLGVCRRQRRPGDARYGCREASTGAFGGVVFGAVHTLFHFMVWSGNPNGLPVQR